MTKEAIVNSALWAALGDALGFVTELGDRKLFEHRLDGTQMDWGKTSWKRKVGGPYGAYINFEPGAYSDDTQLRLAVSRSISSSGIFQKEAFAKIELPIWRAYALGAGLGSLAAAENLSKSSVNWNSNQFNKKNSNYYMGGGNGAAMRIQPHVWSAKDWQHPRIFLLDVVSDSIITHGHSRGILGAAFHAICLALSLANKTALKPELWKEALPFLSDIPTLMSKELSFSSVWLNKWNLDNKLSFEEQVKDTISEFDELFTIFSSVSSGSPEERYIAFAKKIKAVGGNERGSAVKTSVLATAASFLFKDEDPTNSLKSIASLFDSDTDTIATMAGALIGCWQSSQPELPIQDKDYIIKEAERMHAVRVGEAAQAFNYPSILSWKAARSPLEIVSVYQGEFYLSGLGKLTPISKEYNNSNTVWFWATLPYGQKVLVKHRETPLKTDSLPIIGGYSSVSPKQVLPRQNNQGYKQEINTLYQEKTNKQLNLLLDSKLNNDSILFKQIPEIEEIVNEISKCNFNPTHMGEAFSYILNGMEDYIYLSEFTSKLYIEYRKINNK